jgi:uncharacterized repeat protein (TIGR01451 family)
VVRQELSHDVSPPLRELAKTPPALPAGPHEADELKLLPLPSGFKPAGEPDAALQRTAAVAPAELAPTLGLNFEGLGAGFPNYVVDLIPPDTNGAVGQTQYVQWVNTNFAVFDKATGKVLANFPVPGNTLWQGFGGGCETNNDGDPIVTYDKLADRWVFTQFVVRNVTTFLQCVAVSTSSDATGSYNRYSFPYSEFDDYPKLGVWPDAYYITFNIFGSTFLGAEACAYDRNAMLAGQAATQVCFPPDPSVLGLLPSDVDGLVPPPAGSPNFMLSFGVNSLNLFKFHVDFGTPANSTLTGPTNIPVTGFTPALCNNNTSMSCVPQPQPPGDGTLLDTLGDRLMYRLAYRNFGDHESLVVNHSVIAGPANAPNTGVRWYEIQNPSATPLVAQQSTWAPDSSYRWMGSAAMDVSGDMAVGYSVSSGTIFPSIAVAGRTFTDPASTLQAEATIFSGTGSQNSVGFFQPITRWGDYSAMQVDPSDDCTFWYTNEYLATTGNFNWNTRIANFKFPGCSALFLKLAVDGGGPLTQGQGAAFTITVTNTGSGQIDGIPVTFTDTLPVGLTPQPTAAFGSGWTCPPPTGLTISCNRSDQLGPGTSYPPITMQVSVDANAPPSVINTATVNAPGNKDFVHNTVTDAFTITQTGADLAIAKTHSGPFIQGQTGTYTIRVSNVGTSASNGTVTVSDTLPTGLSFNAASGSGWACSQTPPTTGPVSCNRNDVLNAGTSYPAITLTVNVAANAPASVVNTASVAGGSDVNPLNDSASDPTSIIPPPADLTITKTHTGNFNQGQSFVSYTLTVSNVGNGPTVGTVKVTETLPTGLTESSMFGNGWFCNLLQCSRSDVLVAGAQYPPITLFVNVASNAPASVVNTATVSGGGELNTSNDTANDPTTINPSPDLTVTKTHTIDPFVVGQTGTYTITVKNSGNASTAGTVNVNDFLPNGLTATAITGTGWICSTPPTNFVSCSRTDALTAGSSYPALTITVNVLGGGPSVTNTVNVSGGGEFNTSNDSANDLTHITAPILAITKSHTGDFTVGVPGVYTIGVSNTGPVATVGSVTVTDFMPQGMTATSFTGSGWNCPNLPTQFLNCSRSDSLASNSSYPPLNVTVAIASASPTETNFASVTGGGDSLSHGASDPTNVNTPTLAVTKTHSGNFVVGQDAIYEITVSNTGKVATVGTVTLQDFIPNGLTAIAAGGPGWNCSPLPTTFFLTCTRSDSLPTGASYPVLILTANVVGSSGPTVTNSVSVTGGGDGSSHSASDTANVSGPILKITKSHTGNFNQTGVYNITVSNVGALATVGSVTMQDFLPFGLTATAVSGAGWGCSQLPTTFLSCTRSDSLNSGGSYPTLGVTVSVNTSGTITNSASVSGGGDLATHFASDTTTVNGSNAVLAITKTHTGSFTVGQTGSYTIAVSNTGTGATSGTVTLQDFLPFGLTATAATGTGWNCGTLPTTALNCTRSDALNAGSGYPALVVTVNVTGGAPSVTNSATVFGGGDQFSHTASDPTNILGPSLGITKTHTGDPFVVGQTGTYTITVDNKAGKVATSGTVTVQDSLPFAFSVNTISGTGWSCTTAPASCTRSDSLPVGSSYPPISLTVNVNGGGPSVVNSANVSGGGDSQFHFANDTTNVTAPVLAITKSHTPDPFIAGQQGTYTITVSNNGTVATVGSVTVNDFLPNGLTLASSSGAGWGCSGTNSVTCTRSDALAASGSYPALVLTVNIGNSTPSVVNIASVSGGGDSSSHNVSDIANVTTPVLAITKTHTGNFTFGQPGTYTITVSNTGTVATTGTVTVTDFLPFGMTATATSGTGWGCPNLPTSFLTCTRSDALATNSSYPPLVVTVSVNSTSFGGNTVTNTASVTGGGDGLSHSASDPTTINVPTLAISKSHAGNFTVGQPGSYSITVSNVSAVPTSGLVTVQDVLPTGMSVSSMTGTGWACSFGNFFTPNCTRSDSLAGNSSYPPITMAVNIDPSAASSLVNQASVNGGGDPNNHSAFDLTNISFPDLSIAMSHTGNFFQGDVAASYTITVTNVGVVPTAGGTVTVADPMPIGLTATAASGSGWTCSIFNGPQTEMDCTRPAGTLAQGQSYPPITLTARVAVNAPSPLSNTAFVFGIDENNFNNNAASDTATISPRRTGADFDGDGKTDVAIWRPSTGVWWVVRSSDGAGVQTHWGVQGDIPVPGDYDGDGKTDVGIWRPSTGEWWVIRSSDDSLLHATWGVQGDIPVLGDYDGDGKTDLGIWRPSTGEWWIIRSSDGSILHTTWGVQGDIPVPGDYDGDGKTDLGIWRPSTGEWWILRSSDGSLLHTTWGMQGDIPVPGDYSGDGKTDLGIWRPSTGEWWVIRSTGEFLLHATWGVQGDIPVLGDYDGDGKTDLGIWRPSTGEWWVIRSSDGAGFHTTWGVNGDVPMNKPVGSSP